MTVPPDSVGTFRVFLTVAAGAAPKGATPFAFIVRDPTGRKRSSHDSVFVGPAP